MVTGIVTARLLGVEGRGQTALVFALGLFASQLTFGGSLPIAIVKNIAVRHVAARDGLRSLARRRFVLLFIPCLASAALMVFLQRSEPADERYGLAAAVFVMVLQTIVFRVQMASFQGELAHLGRVGRMAVYGMLPQFLFTTAVSTAWVLDWDWGVFDVLISNFVTSFIGLAIAFTGLAKPSRRLEDELDESDLWRDARHSYVSSVRPIDSIGLDRILIGGVLGTAALGLYAAAIAVASLCHTVGGAFSVMVLPLVAQRHDDPAEQGVIIRKWLILTGATMVVVVGLVELIVAPVIRIAFGEEFVGAIECARWLVLADGLLGFRKVLIAALQGRNQASTASWIELALTPVMILAVVAAALNDNLPAIGMAMVVVGALSCTVLGLALRRGRKAVS